jgi:hypothetical protein
MFFRAGVKCMVTLLPVLGLSWLFGVLAFNEETIVFQYLFGITTSCQVIRMYKLCNLRVSRCHYH